ncbi:hypothetical protein D3C84_295800 [compost metagenome]
MVFLRIGEIIAYLINNEDELLMIHFGMASLLNVDEDELSAIKEILLQDPKSFLQEEC